MSAVLGATVGWGGAALADNQFEYHGYWRLGFNTAENPLLEAPGKQAEGLRTTRHTRDPNYFKFNLLKKWDDGTQASLTFDQGGDTTMAHEDNDWTGSKLAVRDLYLSLPLSPSGNALWVGTRDVEYEDVRLFDMGNPFNTNAHGAGVKLGNTEALISFNRDKEESTPRNTTTDKVNVKDVAVYLGHDIALTKTLTLKPKAKYINYGSAPKRADMPTGDKIPGGEGFLLGGVLARQESTSWENSMLWYESEPTDKSGIVPGQDSTIGLSDSSSYEFGDFGLLWAAILEVKTYGTPQPVMIKTDAAPGLVAGKNTTQTNLGLCLAVQPVYYITPKFHAAFDVGYASIDKSVVNNQANVMTLTPILRYAMNKNTLASPQLYTSITYGMYDAKIKLNERGEPTDRLVTTQSGFETWF